MKRMVAVWFVLGVVAVLAGALAPVAVAEAGTWQPLGQLGGGFPGDFVVDGGYAYLAAGPAMTVIDVSEPSAPQMVGYCEMPLLEAPFGDNKGCQRVATAGRYAYLTNWSSATLIVVDKLNVAAPTLVTAYILPDGGAPNDIAAAGAYAYVADEARGLRIVDMSNPSNPSEVGRWPSTGISECVAVVGQYAYLGERDGTFRVIDVSTPAAPVQTGAIKLPDWVQGVAISGTRAYLADATAGLRIIDVSNPSLPVEIGHLDLPDLTCFRVGVSGARAYLTANVSGSPGSMHIIDVSNPAAPTELGHWEPPGFANGVAATDTLAYVADGTGFHVIVVSEPASPTEIGSIEAFGDVGYLAVSSGYAYTGMFSLDYLRVIDASDPAAGREIGRCAGLPYTTDTTLAGQYAYVTTWHEVYGLNVVDVSNPAQPTLINTWEGRPYFPTCVRVAGSHAYLAAGSLEVINVSDPFSPSVAGYLDGLNIDRLALSGPYAYAVGVTGGGASAMYIVDVSNPLLMTQVGFFIASADAETSAAADVAVAGSYAYLACTGDGLRIVDVSSPTSPFQVGWLSAPRAYRVAVSGDYAYLSAGYDGIRVIDVSDPAAPVEVASWHTVGSAGDVVVDDGKVYVSDWSWGLLVFPEFAPSGRLTGQVRERGTTTNLASATVTAYLDGEPQATGMTDAKGIYVIDADLPAGEYTVDATKPGFITQTKNHISVAVEQTTYVNFWLDRMPGISGQVKDSATDLPLVGATVSAYQGPTLVSSTVTVAPYGIYRITGLPAGTYTVVASKIGYVRQGRKSIMVTDGSTTYVNFALAHSGRLKGQVTDKVSGAPIVGATVEAYLGGVLRGSATTTSPWGVYEIYGDLPAGTYLVRASAAGYLPQGKSNIALAPDATTFVNFRLQPLE